MNQLNSVLVIMSFTLFFSEVFASETFNISLNRLIQETTDSTAENYFSHPYEQPKEWSELLVNNAINPCENLPIGSYKNVI